MGERAAASLFHGQSGLGALQRLDLTLFIHAQDDGPFGRVKVKAHHIGELFHKPGIARHLEGLHPVRSQAVGFPNAVHRGGAHPGNGPNSGTTSWFFNENDNSFLDTGDGGPFTVFGKIINTSSLSVMDQIGNLQEYNLDDSSNGLGGLETTPLANNQGIELNGTIYAALTDYVTVNSITMLTGVQDFPMWQGDAAGGGGENGCRSPARSLAHIWSKAYRSFFWH